MHYVQTQAKKHEITITQAVCERLQAYIELLGSWNKVHNLTAIKDTQQQIDWLVMPSIRISTHTQKFTHLMDLGSGGGLPGVVLAIMHPTQRWQLVEKSPKKCAFLRHVVHKLQLKNVTVHEGDFLQMPVDPTCEVIVTRGSCKLPVQIVWTKAWRESGCALYSVQSEDSMAKFALQNTMQVKNLGSVQQDNRLKLLIIPGGVDLE